MSLGLISCLPDGVMLRFGVCGYATDVGCWMVVSRHVEQRTMLRWVCHTDAANKLEEMRGDEIGATLQIGLRCLGGIKTKFQIIFDTL